MVTAAANNYNAKIDDLFMLDHGSAALASIGLADYLRPSEPSPSFAALLERARSKG